MKDICHIHHSSDQDVRDTVREIFTPLAWGDKVSTVHKPLVNVEKTLRDNGFDKYKTSVSVSGESTVRLDCS